MKKLTITFIVLLQFISLSIHSEIVANKNGKCGYTDENGTLVIPYKYDFIGQFSDKGITRVRKGTKQGLVNIQGQEVLPCIYDLIDSFDNNGLAIITLGSKKGLVSDEGALILKATYSNIGKFNSLGYTWVSIEGKKNLYGVIKKDGTVVIPCKNMMLATYIDGENKDPLLTPTDNVNACVINDNLDTLSGTIPYFVVSAKSTTFSTYDVYNLSGELILSILKDVMPVPTEEKVTKIGTISYGTPKEGVIGCSQYFKQGNKYLYVTGFYDLEKSAYVSTFITEISSKAYNNTKKGNYTLWNEEVNQNSVTLHTGFAENHATICKRENGITKVCIINKTGEIVSVHDNSSHYKDGYCVVFDKNLGGGLIDINGNFAIPYKYSAVMPTIKNERWIVKSEKWGVVDLNDSIIVPMEYDTIITQYNTSIVAKDNKWGMYLDTTVAVPCIFDHIASPHSANPNYIMIFTEKWHIYNLLNNTITESHGFDDIVMWDDEIILGYDVAGNDTLYSITNIDGIDIIPYGLTDMKQVTIAYDMLKDIKPGELTEALKRKVLLYLTRGTRRYSIDAIVPTEDWDY